MLKKRIYRNCESCKANYSTYNIKNEKDSDCLEYWCEIPNPDCENKGLCQFCNSKSKYFNK